MDICRPITSLTSIVAIFVMVSTMLRIRRESFGSLDSLDSIDLGSLDLGSLTSGSLDDLDSLDSISEDDPIRQGRVQSDVAFVLPYCPVPGVEDTGNTAEPPYPTASRSCGPRVNNQHLRLRSGSGLAHHTNQPALRQYTDYNQDGTLRPVDIRTGMPSSRGRVTQYLRSAHHSPHTRKLPDFFAPDVIKAALSSPIIIQRLLRFAKTRRFAPEMEFLLKVDEFSDALGSMTCLISQITTNYTGITATSPLRLPAHLSYALNANTKHCARSLLPPIERLYHDAKNSVEHRLANHLYPDFLKFQLAQCTRSSLSAAPPLSGASQGGYPGLGDAFCLTNPHKPGNPIVYASDGLLSLSGYGRKEVVGKSCRIFQGISTDLEARQRLRKAIVLGRETVELVVNHRKDGAPFWNLLLVCPLSWEGSLRFFLGAQINVSESMGSEVKDILRVLDFNPRCEDFPRAAEPSDQEQPPVGNKEPAPPEVPASVHSPQRQFHGYRSFRDFISKSVSAIKRPQTPRAITPVATCPVSEDARSVNGQAFTTENQQQRYKLDEFDSPYPHFFVMQYMPLEGHANPPQTRGHTAARMPVVFSSSFALELLGIHWGGPEDAFGRDIFVLLAEYANLPSASKGLKSAVLESMAVGEAVSVNMMVNTEPPSLSRYSSKHSKAGRTSKAAVAAGGVVGAALANIEADPMARLSGTIDRGAGILGKVLFGAKTRKVVTHWAPLKDGDGEVDYVVLVLTPVAAPSGAPTP